MTVWKDGLPVSTTVVEILRKSQSLCVQVTQDLGRSEVLGTCKHGGRSKSLRYNDRWFPEHEESFLAILLIDIHPSHLENDMKINYWHLKSAWNVRHILSPFRRVWL